MTRAGFLVLHRRIALAIAPFLLIQALTGAALLFHSSLARWLDPAAMVRHRVGAMTPVSQIVRSASDAFPGYRVVRLYLPAERQDTAFAQLSGPAGEARYASIDPGDAQVLASGRVWRFPLEAALQVHDQLLSGKAGMVVILADGIGLLLLGFTGLKFWWPGRGRIARNLTIRAAAPGRLRLRQWHRSGGVLAATLMVFSATTGVLLIVPDLIARRTEQVAWLEPPSGAQIDRAVRTAQAQFPGHRIRDIRFPPTADRLEANIFAPERNARAVHMVSARLNDGRAIKVVPAAQNSVLWMIILPLHSGDSFGLAGQLLLLTEAFVLAALASTGPVMWWQARRRKPRP